MTRIGVWSGVCVTAKCCEHDLQEGTEVGEERTLSQGTALHPSLQKELIESELNWQSKEVIPGSVGLILYLKKQ